MRKSPIHTLFLTTLVLLATTLPLMPNAFAQQCYASSIVGVQSATGVWMQLNSGYDGYTGLRLVTAAHVVGTSARVATSCGFFYQEGVAYKDTIWL